jgi:hypothetical protein
MPSEKGAWAVLSQDPNELKDKTIVGKFIDGGKNVLLLDLVRYGGRFRSNNLSQDGYRATYCLISNVTFPTLSKTTLFSALKIDLTGYEGWLRLGSINSVRTESSISVQYNKSDTVICQMDEGSLSIVYDILGPMMGSHQDDRLSLNEKAFLVFRPQVPITLDEMRRQFRSLEDLFIILTDSDYCFLWPRVELEVDGVVYAFEWYLYRNIGAEKPPDRHGLLTNFLRIRESFGQIVSNWLRKREQYGPGFYLYIGVRRNRQLYTEHFFVNLIWGLEALHRRSTIGFTDAVIKERVARIIEGVKDRNDKKWLKKKLKFAHEPNLADRLYEVINGGPIVIERERLLIFVNRCAEVRNDISHFGEQRSKGSRVEYMQEVYEKARALSVLYHAIILGEIGIDQEIINEWLYRRSNGAATLVGAGQLNGTA